MSGSQQSQGEHPAFLEHHFETPRQQFESHKTGMWLFLSTEILLFSGLFCAYSVYRANHPEIFIYAHQFLDKSLGALNTLVLILSSLTAAWAVRAAQMNNRKQLIGLVVVTLLCACVFLGVKGVEYEHKWKHGLLWGRMYKPHGEETATPPAAPVVGAAGTSTAAGAGAARASGAAAAGTSVPVAPGASAKAPVLGAAGAAGAAKATVTSRADSLSVHSNIAPAAQGPAGLARPKVPGPAGEAEVPADVPRNVQIFFSIYFIMTGLHGVHVIAGMAAFAWVLRRAVRGDFSGEYYTAVDNVALYWHLVDLIWIYLFPLLYLIH